MGWAIPPPDPSGHRPSQTTAPNYTEVATSQGKATTSLRGLAGNFPTQRVSQCGPKSGHLTGQFPRICEWGGVALRERRPPSRHSTASRRQAVPQSPAGGATKGIFCQCPPNHAGGGGSFGLQGVRSDWNGFKEFRDDTHFFATAAASLCVAADDPVTSCPGNLQAFLSSPMVPSGQFEHIWPTFFFRDQQPPRGEGKS